MTINSDDAIRLIQSGLDKLGHTPGTIDGQWGVRTAHAQKQLIAANGRAASAAPQGALPWITEAKTALGRNEGQILTVAGTALVTKGLVQASDLEPVIGALFTIGSVVILLLIFHKLRLRHRK